jgi:hypothetical protein
MKGIFALIICVLAATISAAPKKIAPIISSGRDGRLVYDVDTNGDRVPDFSTCGYAGQDRPVPDAPVRIVVSPVAGDETARIQKALDYVGSLPMDANALRGAVLLLKGRHEVMGELRITNSGVILRGQGVGEDGTTLIAAGLDRRTLIRIVGQNDITTVSNANWVIAEPRVPAGAVQLPVRDASGLHVGDNIEVIRPSTKEWINFLGMTEFGGGIGDWRLTWKPGSRDLVWNRVIQKIANNVLTLDAPITTALETNFGGGYAQTYAWPGRIKNVGVENLRLVSAVDSQNPKDENHAWFAITFENSLDAWVRQVTFEHFAGSAVAIYENCQRVTVEDCLSLNPISEDAGWRRNTFYTMGQQTLFLRCFSEQGRHDFSVGHAAAGPNTFVECESDLPESDSGALGSWSSGTLFDNVRIDGGGLSLGNRGTAGEGAGWSAANSVLWQCNASAITCENPPGARNFAFGCWGEFAGDGVWRNANSSVRPVSLFAKQVADRLGAAASNKVVLMPLSLEEYSNPTPEQAAKLIAESLHPAPSLKDFIAAAAAREPISTSADGAKSVEEIPDAPPAPPASHLYIAVTNGWLTCDGRLLTGSTLGINWWRGNMLPGDAPNYGVDLSRFAPGRAGPGFTDDLDAIADAMQSNHVAALDHHYGLWYDRRREDHERVRRINGDVWAPFYEQPFARSGQGTAWDGLSKYDLTRFNPFYWSRLNQFASICDQRGLVLFNENYFQHNILEAGAHWVDCPWRSANNINHTGFPEPPPFAGDKRIFMAAQFYDVTNPTRRALHRQFIRQNLDNFTNRMNVIQFTSAEFTGPLAFEQFWLDTVAAWSAETGRQPLVALSAPKNVQDAILADDRRRAVVNVICFRYWWQTDDDTFAPDGGQNLSPRQFERRWKGGTPSDEDLASMAAEYRLKFADKAVIASGEDEDLSRGTWAFVCAGGSLPNLPATTDPALLAAIPRMTPWSLVNSETRRVLREPGRQLLIYSGENAPAQLDLSAEAGSFSVGIVDKETGRVTWRPEALQAGGNVAVPHGVVWLKHL